MPYIGSVPAQTALTAAHIEAGAVDSSEIATGAVDIAHLSALIGGATDTITAGSTQTQAGATALTARINRVTVSGTNGDGVALPTAAAGTICEIINGDSAQTIDVWPASGDKIQGGSTDAVDPTSIAAGTSRQYYCIDTAEWLRNIPVGTVLQRQIMSTTSSLNNSTTTEAATPLTDTISLLDAGSAVRVTAAGIEIGCHRNAGSPTVYEGEARLWRTAVTSGTLIAKDHFGRTKVTDPANGDRTFHNITMAAVEDSPATKSATTYVVGTVSVSTDVLVQFNGYSNLAHMMLEEIAT